MKVDPKNLAANFLTVLAVPFVVLLVLVLELLKALPISWLRQAARRFEAKLGAKPTAKETFAPSRSWQKAMGDEIQFWDIANRQERQRRLEGRDLPQARTRHPGPMELKEDDR